MKIANKRQQFHKFIVLLDLLEKWQKRYIRQSGFKKTTRWIDLEDLEEDVVSLMCNIKIRIPNLMEAKKAKKGGKK